MEIGLEMAKEGEMEIEMEMKIEMETEMKIEIEMETEMGMDMEMETQVELWRWRYGVSPAATFPYDHFLMCFACGRHSGQRACPPPSSALCPVR